MTATGGYTSDLFGAVIPPNVIVVDAVNGNDATGKKGNSLQPFKTGLAAETVAVSGDVVHFLAGTYLDVNMGKDGILYYFDAGAKMTNLVDTDPSTFTDEGKGDIQFKICGYGHFIHERYWNVNNWNVEIVRLVNNSKVDIEGYKFANNGNDGSLFKVETNAGEINVIADEIYSGYGGAYAGGSGRITICSRRADVSYSMQTSGSAQVKLDIKTYNADVPHPFSSFFSTFVARDSGHLEFEGTVNYNPGLNPSGFTAMLSNSNNGGVNKGIIRIKGIINIIGHKLFVFSGGSTADNNLIILEGEVNLGMGASDDLFFTNSPGRLIARNLVIKSESDTRTTGIIPAHTVEFHAESTTIVLSAAEIALGSQAIYATAPSNAYLKSFFSNAPIDAQVTNLVPNGLVDDNNPNIKE